MHITVVGGGFGGVKTALELAKNKKVKITLLSDRPDFQYYPALYSTATGGSHLQSWVPLGEIFDVYDNVTIIIDTVTKLDKTKKIIQTAAGKKLNYDTLVLALGSVTTYFGIPGLDHYAYGIKSKDEITRLKQHLLNDFSKPNGADSHFLIVGAGPTGVELASSMGDYIKHLKKKFGTKQSPIKISIIEAAPRVLPRMSEQASALVLKRLKKLGIHVELNKKVEEETADALIVSGKPIKSHTVIWTSGVANAPFFKANDSQFNLAPNGRVIVDKYLRADKHIYVIGDNAANPFGGLAQVAIKDGHFVAQHILKKSHEKYASGPLPVVVPVGSHWAIFEYKKLHFGGIAGAAIRQAADFIGYKDVLSFKRAFRAWTAQEEREDDAIIAGFSIEKN